MAFCIWDGGYLPTEAESNYAAAGGGDQRAYPWSIPGDSLVLDGSRASYSDGNCVGDGKPACTVADLAPVGSKPAGDGRWGQSDLAGNVEEWTLDWFDSFSSPCVDCANLTPASFRVTRGGAFDTQASSMRASSRNQANPDGRFPEIGVRCARSP
jgi:formylglycine-generating enzyme required for sulfatase activity